MSRVPIAAAQAPMVRYRTVGQTATGFEQRTHAVGQTADLRGVRRLPSFSGWRRPMPTVVPAGVHVRSALGAGAIAQSVHDTRDDGGTRLGASAVAPGADGPHSLAF